jgi:large subunit ribosomal protein L9
MQLILTKDMPTLGQAGDLVTVKPGYGSNYLLPKGLALIATTGNKSKLEHQKRVIERKVAKARESAEAMGRKLNGTDVTITRLVGEGDKLFGSVTNRDIAEALAKDGIEVDSRYILLDAPLKALGVYEVEIKLHRDVGSQIKVWVVAD